MNLDKEIKKLQSQVSANQMSRRAFMTSVMALGVGALAPGLYSQAAKAAPKKGGVFRVGIGAGNTTDSLDPGLITSLFSQVMLRGGVRNNLVRYTNTNELIGELAESWEASPDAAQWTFKLRDGVEFHNGKTLDANDVVVSIRHHVAEGTTSAAKPIVEPIESVQADGKNTIVFNLKEGNADFPFTLYDYHVQICPANSDGTMDWQSGVGTGAYIMKNYDPGVRARLTKFANYWDESRGHFDEIDMTTISDVVARTSALTTGAIDAMDRCDLKTVHLLERNSDVNVVEVTGTGHYTFPMFTDVAPFDDNNVRMALKHAINREALVKTILKGHGVAGNDHPIATANRYHNKDLPQRVYDPEKAKWYLKQSGLSSLDVDLRVADAAFAGAVDAGVLYKEHASAAGININVVRVPSDGYWDNIWLTEPFVASYWGGRQVEDQMFSTAYQSGAPWNDTHFNHENFDRLLIQGRTELDDAKRRDIYYEMQRIVSDEGGAIVPMFYNYVSATSKKVQYLDDGWASDADLDGYMGIQHWWFA